MALLLGACALVSAHAAPANDNFVDRITITGMASSVTGSNVGASKEAGEPNHAGSAGGKSAWWTWTAPMNGTVTMDTTGSAFDTLLAVYTGTVVASLTVVASNDDNGLSVTSLVNFTAAAGAVYQIAVDDYNGAAGNIVLSARQTGQGPVVTVFPTNANVAVCGNAIFTAFVTGSGPFGYQWYVGVAPVAGANGDSLTLTNVQAGQAGAYSVVVTNSLGAATNSATLSLLSPIVVSNEYDSGPGSLRDAITQANSNPGPDVITFNIPGGGVRTIAPVSGFPSITGTVTLDATTQPGYAGTPMVVVVGFLDVATSGSLIQGLCLQQQGIAITIRSGGGNIVSACFKGTSATGGPLSPVTPNETSVGIQIGTSSNLVTGSVISGNGAYGINLIGGSGNVIRENRIGTDAAGPNGAANGTGINNGTDGSGATLTLIGGATPAARNIISGSRQAGIILGYFGATTTIQGNYIGTDISGNARLLTGDSGAYGIRVQVGGTIIGGTGLGEANVIAGSMRPLVSFGQAGSQFVSVVSQFGTTDSLTL